ncbi:MAG TPA: hypothetical protein VFV92_03385, partial [Candidatus Bathyarchaeia archaeon]|nr:hypothetical protein [Candidatus Bathyarchaeia archaeon]
KIDRVLRHPMARSELQNILEAWAGREGAAVKPMGRLVRRYKSKGDNMHWHITGLRDGMGTVEITYTPSARLLTVLVHENRRGTWAGHAYLTLAHQLDQLTRAISRGQTE